MPNDNFNESLWEDNTDGDVSAIIEKRSSEETKEKRITREDRESNKYSMEDFKNLPRNDQIDLAEKYWFGSVKSFEESKLFKFSYTTLCKICKSIGLRKGVIDTLKGKDNGTDVGKVNEIIYIDHGRRNSSTKKLTLSQETIDLMNSLLGDNLANAEKSKIIDAILRQALEDKLSKKDAGKLAVIYRPVKEERIL